MSLHTFICLINRNHVIFDSSDEPVPHIGEDEQIYCDYCEQDVSGTYIGQYVGDEFTYGDYPSAEDVDLYVIDGEPYCINCDGPCEN